MQFRSFVFVAMAALLSCRSSDSNRDGEPSDSAAESTPDVQSEADVQGQAGCLDHEGPLSFKTETGPTRCCAGLMEVGIMVWQSGMCTQGPADGANCIVCGDGTCGAFENHCSCPADCPP